MQPNDPKSPQPNDRNLAVPHRDQPTPLSTPQRHAAANIVRSAIDHIYETDPPNQPAEGPEAPPAGEKPHDNPYQRTHNSDVSAQTWQHYHSAWQNYYQQYYHRYYAGQLHTQKKNLEAERAKIEAKRNFEDTTPKTVIGGPAEESAKPKVATPVDAVKQELVGKVSERAKKLRKSRHFLPIISAVAVGLIFLGIQYNQLVMAQVLAYVSPGSAQSQNIILDPTTDTKVSQDPRLIIPKINVDVPVVYGLKSIDNDTVESNLRNGVVHYPIPGADSMPGQAGNTVVLGHSSNDVFDPGSYKFAFLLLDRLDKGDTFYLNYQGTRYTYTVTEKKIIEPTEVSTLVINTNKPIASLVTCTPAGTALHRLVIFAEQVSPDPAKANAAPTQNNTNKPSDIPSGNARTLFEQLFGG